LWVSPLTFVEASTPGTGGFVESGNQRLAVQHVSPISTSKQLAAVPVEGVAGNRLRLGDVTEVVEDHQPLIGDASTTAGPGLMLALLVLLGFWRAAVLALATVPLTVFGTAGLLSAAGAQLTTMTLLGLAVAMLVAVDDAVLAGHLASRAEVSRREVAARLLRV